MRTRRLKVVPRAAADFVRQLKMFSLENDKIEFIKYLARIAKKLKIC